MKKGLIIFIVILVIVIIAIVIYKRRNPKKDKDKEQNNTTWGNVEINQGPGYYDSEGMYYGGSLPSSAVESSGGTYTIQNGIVIKYFS